MLTVSLIEDDKDYQQLLTRLIRATKSLVLLSAYSTAEDALKGIPKEKPAVVLVDIKLPGTDGIECVSRLCSIAPPLPTQFIMVTGYDDPSLIFKSFNAGANGYLLKDQNLSSHQLGAHIEEVFTGGSPLTPAIARQVITHFKRHPHPKVRLTNQEQKVLLYLKEGLMYKEIAGELSVSMDTIRFHVSSIYAKLHVHSRSAAVRLYRDD